MNDDSVSKIRPANRPEGGEAMERSTQFEDDLGPAKIVHVHEPSVGLRAVVVIDNVAAGPSIGGVRMAPDVSTEECFRLARAMTFKNAAASLPHGGGKSVISADPRMPAEEKQRLIRAFAGAIGDLNDYIPGPDMGTDETCMAWVKDEIGRAVGLPREIGGIPLDEIGATGFGVAVAAEVAQGFCGMDLEGARVAVQGFGSVGIHAAAFLAGKGAVLVAAADSGGTIVNPHGLDLEGLAAHKAAGGNVSGFPGGEALDRDAVIDADCEIWIPAARPDIIHADNVARLRAKLVIEGANIPVTPEAEQALHDSGVLCIPDFIANAGGVICGATEYHDGTQTAAFQAIEEKIRANTEQVLRESAGRAIPPRQAALEMADRRVRQAMAYRRW